MVHFVDVHIMLCFLDVSCWWRPVKDVTEVLFPASVCLCSISVCPLLVHQWVYDTCRRLSW